MEMNNDKNMWCNTGSGLSRVAISMLAAFLLIVSIFFVAKTGNELKGLNRTMPAPTINVSGEGKEFVKPDIGTVNIGVVKQRADLLSAQKEAADVIDRVIAMLKEKGVADKDQKTVAFNINPQYDYRDGIQKFRGYEVRQTLEVKIRDLNKVGEILAGAAGAGANEIGSLNFTVDNPKVAQEKARATAIAEAKQKAAALARDLGVRIVKIASYSESGGTPPMPYFGKAVYGMGMGGAADVQAPAGENEINVSVNITYEIK